MAIDKGIAANILAASTKTIGGKVYGTMFLGISGGRDKLNEAIEYIGSVSNVAVKVVERNAAE